MAVSGDVRVRDYLDDRLQTAADLDSLDSLLDTIKSQQLLLRQQLNDARTKHTSALQESQASAQVLREKESASRKQQADAQHTLLDFTNATSPEDAVTRFDAIKESVRKVEVAKVYLELGKEAQVLSTKCMDNVTTDTNKAIESYEQLESIAKGLPSLQETSGAAPKLMAYVHGIAATARQAIVEHVSTQLEHSLKIIGWPKASATIPSSLADKWKEQIGQLLDVQRPQLRHAADVNATRSDKDEPVVLAPFEVLVKPLALRFQYHFSGDRLTNRLDKPEYFLNHVLELIEEYSGFVQAHLQGLLLKHYKDGDLSYIPAYVDATCALITALMPMLRRKLQNIIPQMAKQSNLFSNLIHEVMTFDAKLIEDWDYAPLSTSIPFRGLSHYVLSELEYFPAWFAVERDFALARYDATISDRSTGLIDFDGVEAKATKPTKAAIRVNDLLETITDRYRTLSSFHQKMKFLIDIQIAIFDKFHLRLQEGLEAYITITSAVGRRVHGVSAGESGDVSGVKGLDRVLRVFGSAEYLEKAMQDWSEDTFFLDLWEELQYRSQQRGQIKGDLSMADIAAKTSSNVGTENDIDELQGALFDETAASYRRLRVRAEGVLVDAIVYDVRAALRPYSKVNTWASMASTSSSHSQTAELDGATRLLDEYLAFLARTLGPLSLRRVVRQIGLSAQQFIWDNVLIRHTFSTDGANQLRADIDGLCGVFDRHTGPLQGSRSLAKLVEGVRLVSLPLESDDQGVIGLQEAESKMFASNEGAREVLEELGLNTLSESEGRELLKRRAEAAA